MFLDLRYIRVPVADLENMGAFASSLFGLQLADQDNDTRWLRSDHRNYALCLTKLDQSFAVALSVARREDLCQIADRLAQAGYPSHFLDAEAAAWRQCKDVLLVQAPNGIAVELVWRPLTSGWRYHGPRDAGITGLAAVQIGCKDIAANEHFWVQGLGLRITDWIGEATMLSCDTSHHQVALYPSTRDALIGAAWHVEGKDQIMQNWYAAQAAQVPVVAGPDRQAASGAMYVSLRSPEDFVFSYFAEMDAGPHIQERGPRQFSDSKTSHGIWGSNPTIPEFKGRIDD